MKEMNRYQRSITGKFLPNNCSSFIILDGDNKLHDLFHKKSRCVDYCIDDIYDCLDKEGGFGKDNTIHECVLVDGTASIIIDVYDVLQAFDVTNPATAHAIKKLLVAGGRGYKDVQQDLDEAVLSIQRAKEL
jgi:hypothetical protein